MTLPQQVDPGTLQRRILHLCEQRGWSRYHLAGEAGLQPSTVYSIFSPARQTFSVRHSTAVKLATALDVPVGVLFGATDDGLSALTQLWNALTDSQRARLVAFANALRAEQG